MICGSAVGARYAALKAFQDRVGTKRTRVDLLPKLGLTNKAPPVRTTRRYPRQQTVSNFAAIALITLRQSPSQ